MDGNRSAQDILDEIVDRSKRPPSPFYEQTRRMRPLPVLYGFVEKGAAVQLIPATRSMPPSKAAP